MKFENIFVKMMKKHHETETELIFLVSDLPILGLEIDFLENVFFLFFQLRLIDDPLVLLEFLGLRLIQKISKFDMENQINCFLTVNIHEISFFFNDDCLV